MPTRSVSLLYRRQSILVIYALQSNEYILHTRTHMST